LGALLSKFLLKVENSSILLNDLRVTEDLSINMLNIADFSLGVLELIGTLPLAFFNHPGKGSIILRGLRSFPFLVLSFF
jgi:hypothetical protein